MASDEKLSLILKSLDKLQLAGDKLKSVASNGIIPRCPDDGKRTHCI